jgi:hypothetical protein
MAASGAAELAAIPHFNLVTAKWGPLPTNSILLSSTQRVNVLLSANEKAVFLYTRPIVTCHPGPYGLRHDPTLSVRVSGANPREIAHSSGNWVEFAPPVTRLGKATRGLVRGLDLLVAGSLLWAHLGQVLLGNLGRYGLE